MTCEAVGPLRKPGRENIKQEEELEGCRGRGVKTACPQEKEDEKVLSVELSPPKFLCGSPDPRTSECVFGDGGVFKESIELKGVTRVDRNPIRLSSL